MAILKGKLICSAFTETRSLPLREWRACCGQPATPPPKAPPSPARGREKEAWQGHALTQSVPTLLAMVIIVLVLVGFVDVSVRSTGRPVRGSAVRRVCGGGWAWAAEVPHNPGPTPPCHEVLFGLMWPAGQTGTSPRRRSGPGVDPTYLGGGTPQRTPWTPWDHLPLWEP